MIVTEVNIMEENNNEIKTNNKTACNEDKICHLIKFAALLVTLFLACYLAVYYIMDQIRHSYYLPAVPIENIDRIIKEQDRMFEKELGAFPMHNKALKRMASPIETYKDDKKDAYKIIINLKNFDNNEKNIKLNINDNNVTIIATNTNTTKKEENFYTYTQSFNLPEKINTKLITKEKLGNKYIITLPLENPMDDLDED